MSKKLVLLMTLTIVLMGMLGVVLKVQRVKASRTIYIRANGLVDPPTAPIQRDEDLYTFTNHINDSIVVERDNIVVDGAGYTVQGTRSDKGIDLTGRSNVTIKNMEIKAFTYGIYLNGSSINSISKNNITASNGEGIWLKEASANIISGNNIANNSGGIWLLEALSNIISGNNIANNEAGIWLGYSSINIISGNNITANNYGGIWLKNSSANIISGNNITANKGEAIWLDETSNNVIYHNNFMDNTKEVTSTSSTNIWDDGYPSGGNYWSDHTEVDSLSGPHQNETGSDGISDAAYSIDTNNMDRFPLVTPITVFDAGTWNGTVYNVDVVSNSTVSDFYFNPDKGTFVKFNVTGVEETVGFCRVTIPKQLLWVEDGWTILVGGEPTDYTIISDENYTYIYFTYQHSIKTVEIQGTHAIPEFPSFIIMPLCIIATLVALIVSRRKHST